MITPNIIRDRGENFSDKISNDSVARYYWKNVRADWPGFHFNVTGGYAPHAIIKPNPMCAINPKREAHFKLSFYTAHQITDNEWEAMVTDYVIRMESIVNQRSILRCHIFEYTFPSSTEGQTVAETAIPAPEPPTAGQ